MMSQWRFKPGVCTAASLGLIPAFFHTNDPRPATEQLHERYAHGGGYMPFGKDEWRLERPRVEGVPSIDPLDWTLHYPGDPVFEAGAYTILHGVHILYYPQCQLLCFVRLDMTFTVTRVD